MACRTGYAARGGLLILGYFTALAAIGAHRLVQDEALLTARRVTLLFSLPSACCASRAGAPRNRSWTRVRQRSAGLWRRAVYGGAAVSIAASVAV